MRLDENGISEVIANCMIYDPTGRHVELTEDELLKSISVKFQHAAIVRGYPVSDDMIFQSLHEVLAIFVPDGSHTRIQLEYTGDCIVLSLESYRESEDNSLWPVPSTKALTVVL